ncbi:MULTISPECIES: hypothetical protein [unclassified Rhodococcus (in: high G+C Gram-positive bacteria)]|uniref:hypothetical protein n=1 Tax=unclassified Rhodococcus (in: high G+C Gram-positive bacteria) TaxID=192944 RepID=UPI000AB8B510|nr:MULTISPECIES: hypothetical protein [unclassified Rhodococcus (in: high G+C Gram-positive bacteria)]MBY6676960.1 hypothetical protein [Rhodococcus sp. BP-332]MBY6680547.1 hypothetical protein [Rhodococcus sp. BP-316]MBY6684893.1 hypothetical protein [Rhodococcus sp. BP-288]MBY6692623.1 hypothetical protein [Rhodococcus sp. BP-188]MBY6698521.1 hypothetical protein [Rhodococcus sp. BP-285]
MSTPTVDAAGAVVPDTAGDAAEAPVMTCLFEHTTAGIVLMVALCAGMAAFVAAAVNSFALGALVGVLMIGMAGMAVVLVPVERR